VYNYVALSFSQVARTICLNNEGILFFGLKYIQRENDGININMFQIVEEVSKVQLWGKPEEKFATNCECTRKHFIRNASIICH
jgi:hypothetical protein